MAGGSAFIKEREKLTGPHGPVMFPNVFRHHIHT